MCRRVTVLNIAFSLARVDFIAFVDGNAEVSARLTEPALVSSTVVDA